MVLDTQQLRQEDHKLCLCYESEFKDSLVKELKACLKIRSLGQSTSRSGPCGTLWPQGAASLPQETLLPCLKTKTTTTQQKQASVICFGKWRLDH